MENKIGSPIARIELLLTQDLAFTANYGFYKPRKKTYNKWGKIHLLNELVRFANFAWIFTCYWNRVNSNKKTSADIPENSTFALV